MALSVSVEKVDETGRELLTYGTEDFPIAFFDDDLTEILVPYHWHDELEIVIITEGAVRVRIAGIELSLKAGDGYFANSGILHSEVLTTATGHQHALVFSPEIAAKENDLVWKTYIALVLGNPRIPFLSLSSSVPWQRKLLLLAEEAWNQGAYETKAYPIHVRTNLSHAFALITDHIDALEKETYYTSSFQRDELRIKKALVYIERNYDSAVTIEDIAESASISTSTCLRLFRVVLNTTPIRYLMKYRIQKAAEELKHINGRTVADIAHSCGFTDASYFNRCFRREYGKTPSEFFHSYL